MAIGGGLHNTDGKGGAGPFAEAQAKVQERLLADGGQQAGMTEELFDVRAMEPSKD